AGLCLTQRRGTPYRRSTAAAWTISTACSGLPAASPASRRRARKSFIGRLSAMRCRTSRSRRRNRTRCTKSLRNSRCETDVATGCGGVCYRNAPDAGDTRMSSQPERLEKTVDPKLLEILVCPLTKGPLEFDAAKQELISRSAKLAYPIRDGIPIMLPEEARKIE